MIFYNMSYYHVRITYDIDSEEYKTYAQQRTLQHIIVKENADQECKQPHLHFHSKTLHKNDQAFRREFKKWFPQLQGNSSYSLKQGNEIGYRYVCKGTDPDWDIGKPEVLSSTFSEEEIKEFHRQYWNHNQRVIVDTTQVPDVNEKVKKPRAKQFLEKIRDEIVELYPNKQWNIALDTDLDFLVDYLYTKLGTVVKKVNKQIFSDFLNAIYMGLPKTYECREQDKQDYKLAYLRQRNFAH